MCVFTKVVLAKKQIVDFVQSGEGAPVPEKSLAFRALEGSKRNLGSRDTFAVEDSFLGFLFHFTS